MCKEFVITKVILIIFYNIKQVISDIITLVAYLKTLFLHQVFEFLRTWSGITNFPLKMLNKQNGDSQSQIGHTIWPHKHIMPVTLSLWCFNKENENRVAHV